MSLNATECCRTIGCNCAGTQLIENMNWLTTNYWLLSLIGIVSLVFILAGIYSYLHRGGQPL